VVLRAEDNHLLQGLAAEGIGAVIMPYLAIDRHRDDIVLIDLADRIPNRRIGLAWHRDRYRSPAATAFIELAHDAASRLAGEIERRV
jgi:DNA-binding transcriptional LysR family regulator